MCVCVCVYMYTYIYIYSFIHLFMYPFIYMNIYIDIWSPVARVPLQSSVAPQLWSGPPRTGSARHLASGEPAGFRG